jgi:ribosomal protein S18 acetylase RimI-like enzyme
MSNVTIEILKNITKKQVNDFKDLVIQLSSSIEYPSKEYLTSIISNNNIKLLVAINNNKIIGTLTIAIINLISGKKARIEDVVVDINFRKQGIGKKLVQFAEKLCVKLNIKYIDLTSHPKRIAANKLYQHLGYIRGQTNVYIKNIIKEER